MNRLFTFFLFSVFLLDQVIGSTEPRVNPGLEKHYVDSVNTHFYTIYSQDFGLAKKAILDVIDVSLKNGWLIEEAFAQKNLGVILYLKGEYNDALPAYLRSYHLFDSLGHYSGLAQVSNEMANFYRKNYGFEKGISFLDTAKKYATKSGDLRTLGTSYGMRGAFYWVREEYDSSKHYYLKCYDIRLQQNDSVGLGYLYLDLADIERRQGNFEETIAYAKKSIEIRKQIRDIQGILESEYALAEFYFKHGDYEKSLSLFKPCVEKAETFGYLDLKRKTLAYISKCNFELGYFRDAYMIQEETTKLNDSLFNVARTNAIEEVQSKYDLAKKERQIDVQRLMLSEQRAINARNIFLIVGLATLLLLLAALVFLLRLNTRRKINLMKQREKTRMRELEIAAAISSQEKERKRFAQDLHDGFGQLISVLNINLETLREHPERKEEVFENSTEVLAQMYKELKGICFNLMPETLIKNGLKDAIDEFALRINNAGRVQIETNFFGLEERLSDLQEISIYRITQEWVNNIIKYSDADRISLSFTKDEKELTLLIEDDGSSFDKDLLIKSTGSGWKNMNSRANLIKGELELESSIGQRGNSLILNAPSDLVPENQEVDGISIVS